MMQWHNQKVKRLEFDYEPPESEAHPMWARTEANIGRLTHVKQHLQLCVRHADRKLIREVQQ
eukprot:3274046-Prorocentrum_lima.AAC.1